MLRIAVCDDDFSQLQTTENLLKDYLRERPTLSGQISLFESGQALLNAAGEYKGFDIYILDILMPGLNGIQTAYKLRKLEDGGEVIYLTSSNDYAADSYNTRAFFYLLKPVKRETLFSVLDAVFSSYFNQAAKHGIAVKANISLPDPLPVDEAELSVVFANALENAIHANLSLPEAERRLRCQVIGRQSLMFELSNPCEGKVRSASMN